MYVRIHGTKNQRKVDVDVALHGVVQPHILTLESTECGCESAISITAMEVLGPV
jgi:hypothetical protein